MRPYQLICITGPDGSGKSTLINALKNDLPGSVITSIWDLLKEPSRQQVVPFKTPVEVDAYLSCLHAGSRSLFLMHCLLEALEIAKEKKPAYILTDSYWYKYYATEIAHGASPAYLDKLVTVFEKPDHLFYIRAGEDLTTERKKYFSGYECGFAGATNEKTFSAFQQKAIAIMQNLMHSLDYTELDAHASPGENQAIILQSLNIARHENSDHYRH
jgi:dTMP kinase